MRRKRVSILFTILFVLLGLAAILVSLFAFQFGLDNNPVMGQKRQFLLCLGILLLLLPEFWLIGSWANRRFGWVKKLAPVIAWINHKENAPHTLSKFELFFQKNDWIWPVLSSLIVILTAAWYLTAGTFKQWTPYSHYYDRQADAFLAGKLSLLETPPAALAQLKDVYNWKDRQGISYLWDASYYQGKYYLYWGPVPALLASGVKLIHPVVIEDQFLVFFFISGLGIVMSALFYWLRKRYFQNTPGWMIFLFSLTALFCVPIFWLINRPDVYEAAIASAQFFLMLGVYSALRGIDQHKIKIGWLIVTGFSFGAAVGSRFSYVFTVIALSLVMLITLLIHAKKKIAAILSFGLPLGLFAIGLAWFNYTRFGSIFESGLRYQLTGDALPDNMNLLFSLGYFIPNAYSSLLRPFTLTLGHFPFFSTPFVLDNMWPNWVHRPDTYYSGEPVTGVLVSIPFLWLLAILLIKWIRSGIHWVNDRPKMINETAAVNFPTWAIWLVVAGTAGQLITTLSYVMATMRFLADFTPMLILSTAILVLFAYTYLREFPVWRRLFSAVIVLLCVMSIATGLFVNMQGADHRFESNNPQLYSEISTFFNSCFGK